MIRISGTTKMAPLFLQMIVFIKYKGNSIVIRIKLYDHVMWFCDYYLRSSPPLYVMGPSIHRTSPLENIRRIGPYTIH